MTDLVLRDIAPDMAARIRRLAEAQGCTSHDVIVEVLDAGVRACEDALRKWRSRRRSSTPSPRWKGCPTTRVLA